ncbi:hypothetical protein KW785_00220 [Candidatus Parcubacteria bacterium]|nr:hypothetical protein [Candidatus Parcubacteria bacterium]
MSHPGGKSLEASEVCLLLLQCFDEENVADIEVDGLTHAFGYLINLLLEAGVIKKSGLTYRHEPFRYEVVTAVIENLVEKKIATVSHEGHTEMLELGPGTWGRIESLLRERGMSAEDKRAYLPYCRKAFQYYKGDIRSYGCDE